MRRTIRGRVYDTDKSRLLAEYESAAGPSGRVYEALYAKDGGEMFLCLEGGEGSGIRPLTDKAAREWAGVRVPDRYEGIFGSSKIAVAEGWADVVALSGGASLGVYFTRELREAGINRGDRVYVRMERIE